MAKTQELYYHIIKITGLALYSGPLYSQFSTFVPYYLVYLSPELGRSKAKG